MVNKVQRREVMSAEVNGTPPGEEDVKAFEGAVTKSLQRHTDTGDAPEASGDWDKSMQNPYVDKSHGRAITAADIDAAKPQVVLTVIVGSYQNVPEPILPEPTPPTPSCAPPQEPAAIAPIAQDPSSPAAETPPAAQTSPAAASKCAVDAWDPSTWDDSKDDPNEKYLTFGDIKVWLAPVFAEMNISQPGSPPPAFSPSQIAEQRRQQRNGQQGAAPAAGPQSAPSAPVIRA